MRAVIVSVVILVVMITGLIIGETFLEGVANGIDDSCDKICDVAFNEEFNVAYDEYMKLKNYWMKKKNAITAIIDHAYSDEIDKSLKELEVSIMSNDSMEALLACARIKTTIKAVSQNEHFHLNNIL